MSKFSKSGSNPVQFIITDINHICSTLWRRVQK